MSEKEQKIVKSKVAIALHYLPAKKRIKNFEEVKWAFDEVDQSTAPQGMGYSCNCKMIGDPFLTVPYNILFKEGFAAPLTQSHDPLSKQTTFFIKKSTHTFSKSGYFTDVEIVDAYAATGSFIAARTNIGAFCW